MLEVCFLVKNINFLNLKTFPFVLPVVRISHEVLSIYWINAIIKTIKPKATNTRKNILVNQNFIILRTGNIVFGKIVLQVYNTSYRLSL